MKKLIVLLLLVFGGFFLQVNAHEGCTVIEMDDRVMTDLDCPGQPGQIYKKCVRQDNKCCNAEEGESCPSLAGI